MQRNLCLIAQDFTFKQSFVLFCHLMVSYHHLRYPRSWVIFRFGFVYLGKRVLQCSIFLIQSVLFFVTAWKSSSRLWRSYQNHWLRSVQRRYHIWSNNQDFLWHPWIPCPWGQWIISLKSSQLLKTHTFKRVWFE